MAKLVHLWWLYRDQGKDGTSPAAALKTVDRAFSLCGKKDLPKEEITVHPDDTTCDICKMRARAEAA